MKKTTLLAGPLAAALTLAIPANAYASHSEKIETKVQTQGLSFNISSQEQYPQATQRSTNEVNDLSLSDKRSLDISPTSPGVSLNSLDHIKGGIWVASYSSPGQEHTSIAFSCRTKESNLSTCMVKQNGNKLQITGNSPEKTYLNYSTPEDLLAITGGEVSTQANLVGVPWDYIYDPSWSRWGVYVIQHDYCTASPDKPMGADFRGPCARHDMCYEKYNHVGGLYIPNPVKAWKRDTNCQLPFAKHMEQNCRHAHHWASPGRLACYSYTLQVLTAVRAAIQTQP